VSGTPLLTAHWRNLLVVNYAIDPRILAPLAPAGTELDLHDGGAFLSLVGFLFERTRLAGRIPLWPCATFEEVNLRFYVRRHTSGGVRRAVAFVREVVPCRVIAWGARLLYGEPYVSRRMAHRWELEDPGAPDSGGRFSYRWESGGDRFEIAARTSGGSLVQRPGSFEEYILAHEWGYTRLPGSGTREYRVAHPPWSYRQVEQVEVGPLVGTFYPVHLSSALAARPHSAFVATGSEVSVFRGSRIELP
jgi:uncharacterized protein YqjF (DUF2071 family)